MRKNKKHNIYRRKYKCKSLDSNIYLASYCLNKCTEGCMLDLNIDIGVCSNEDEFQTGEAETQN